MSVRTRHVTGWVAIAFAVLAGFLLNQTRMAVLSYGTFLAWFLVIVLLTVVAVFYMSKRPK